MSSTTSIGECEELCNCPLASMQEPWFDYYQNTGHPLVYYAQVQPSFPRSRSRAKKGSPNFFVKAFRWYTQEHHPLNQNRDKTNEDHAADFSNFANWLDYKYGQFIYEECQQNTQCSVSTEQCKNKKLFSSVKSRFKKRCNVKGNRDISGKSNSCENIMKPSCTASTYTRTNIRDVCSDTVDPKKSAIKSFSGTNSRLYKVDYEKSLEIVKTEGDGNMTIEDKRSCTKTEILTIYENNQGQMRNMSNKFSCDRRYADIECQCSVPSSVAKVDAFAQYDDWSTQIPPARPQTDHQPRQEAETRSNGTKNNNECDNRCLLTKKNSKHRKPVVSETICKSPTSASKPPNALNKVAKVSEVSCQCSDAEVTKCEISCQYSSTGNVKIPKTKKIKDPQQTCQNVSQVTNPSPNLCDGMFDKSVKSFNECTCTRSFQDKIRTICMEHDMPTVDKDQTISQNQTNIGTTVTDLPVPPVAVITINNTPFGKIEPEAPPVTAVCPSLTDLPHSSDANSKPSVTPIINNMSPVTLTVVNTPLGNTTKNDLPPLAFNMPSITPASTDLPPVGYNTAGTLPCAVPAMTDILNVTTVVNRTSLTPATTDLPPVSCNRSSIGSMMNNMPPVSVTVVKRPSLAGNMTTRPYVGRSVTISSPGYPTMTITSSATSMVDGESITTVFKRQSVASTMTDLPPVCVPAAYRASLVGARTARPSILRTGITVPSASKPLATPVKCGRVCTCKYNDTQTSDHSIQLDEVTRYPFFMKIVRPDKLPNKL